MSRTRKILAMVAGGALLAGSIAVAITNPASAATIAVKCTADDSVLQGSATLNGNPLAASSQDVLNLIGATQDPPIPAPVSLTNPLRGSAPGSVPPGSSEIELTVELMLADDLVNGLQANGVTAVNLSNMDATIAAGSGVSGPNVTLNPANATVNPSSPTFPSATVAQTYDVTAAIGETITWNLVEAHVGVSLTVPPSATIPGTVEMQFGLECAQEDSGALMSAIVLPPFVSGGPLVPALSVTTAEDTPVDVDLLAGVGEGDAPTDPASLSVIGAPADGNVTLDGGTATYTPRTGFAGTDSFAYEVCTVEFSIDGANQITELTGLSDGDEFALAINGVHTEMLTVPLSVDDLQAAIDTAIGAGNAAVTESDDGFLIEWTGELAETVVDVVVDTESDITVLEDQAAQAGAPGTLCNSNVVTVTVTASGDGDGGGSTTTTAPPGTSPPAATPQSQAASFTG